MTQNKTQCTVLQKEKVSCCKMEELFDAMQKKSFALQKQKRQKQKALRKNNKKQALQTERAA